MAPAKLFRNPRSTAGANPMTIFNRSSNNNTPDNNTNTGRTTAMPETPATPSPQPAAPRPQAYAQPISVSTPTTGAPMTSVLSKAVKITGQIESSENIQIDG